MHWLKRNKRRIAQAFHAVLRERYAIDARRIVVEWEHAYARVLEATLEHIAEDIWGQTDGVVIELHDRIAEYGVCRVTATLAHEALHNTIIMRRKTRSRRCVALARLVEGGIIFNKTSGVTAEYSNYDGDLNAQVDVPEGVMPALASLGRSALAPQPGAVGLCGASVAAVDGLILHSDFNIGGHFVD